jgi:hypothetical protein
MNCALVSELERVGRLRRFLAPQPGQPEDIMQLLAESRRAGAR